MYTIENRVRYSEVDETEQITLPGIINYFQDCSTFQSEDLGIGMHYLKEKRKGWILSYWQVVVNRYPGLGETVKVSTWPTGFDKLYGTRNFQMKDENGEMLACANSVWVFMDFEKGRPTKPDAEDIARYVVEDALEMQYEPRKITRPEETEALPALAVRKSQIDTNQHVNNCQYVQMALDVLPENLKVHQVRVEYRKSAVYGDIIYPGVAREAGRTVVELCDEEKKPYAVIEWIGEER